MKFDEKSTSAHHPTISYHTYENNIHLTALSLCKNALNIEHTIGKCLCSLFCRVYRWAFRRFTVAILPKINGNKLLHKFPFLNRYLTFVRSAFVFFQFLVFNTRHTDPLSIGPNYPLIHCSHFVEHLWNGEQSIVRKRRAKKLDKKNV